MNSAYPSSPAPFRVYRLVGLGLAYLGVAIGPAIMSGYFELEVLSFTPGLIQLLILGAMAYQGFRLVRPWHAGPRRIALHNTNGVVEGAMIIFGLLCIYGAPSLSGGPDAAMLADVARYEGPFAALSLASELPMESLLPSLVGPILTLLGVVLIVGLRKVAVIDGEAGRVIELGTLPRVYDFASFKGLGLVEVRHIRRGGGHAGSIFHIGAFPTQGTPRRLYAVPAAGAAQAEELLRHVHAVTGVPLGRSQGSPTNTSVNAAG